MSDIQKISLHSIYQNKYVSYGIVFHEDSTGRTTRKPISNTIAADNINESLILAFRQALREAHDRFPKTPVIIRTRSARLRDVALSIVNSFIVQPNVIKHWDARDVEDFKRLYHDTWFTLEIVDTQDDHLHHAKMLATDINDLWKKDQECAALINLIKHHLEYGENLLKKLASTNISMIYRRVWIKSIAEHHDSIESLLSRLEVIAHTKDQRKAHRTLSERLAHQRTSLTPYHLDTPATQ